MSKKVVMADSKVLLQHSSVTTKKNMKNLRIVGNPINIQTGYQQNAAE